MAASKRWARPKPWFAALCAVVAALLGAIVWCLDPGRPRAPVASPAERGLDVQPDSTRGELVDVRAGREVLAVAAEAVIVAPEAPDASAQSDALGETWSLWGHVLRADDGTPIEGLLVVLAEGVSGASDARGRFEVELDAERFPRGARRVVNVVHGSGARLWSEEVVLEPGLELRVDDAVVELRVHVVDPAGADLAVGGVSIARVDPDGVPSFVGMAKAADGASRFVVSAPRRATGPGLHRVNVWKDGTNFPKPALGTALASEAGAEIVLDVCMLRFEVRAPDGATLVEPDLRVVGRRRGAERAEVLSFPELDAEGAAEVAMERDLESVEISVGAEGCATRIEERAAPQCGGTWRIELARFGPDDVLAGVVLDAAGRPVEGANASCSPQAHDREWVAVPAIRRVRTDAEGRFELPFARGSEAVLQAYHRDHGSTGDVLVLGGRRDVVLRFAAVARVDVHVTGPDGASLGAAPARFLLALADGERRFEWAAYGRTWFEEVPAGSHRVLCLSAEGDLWGLLGLEVFDAQPLEWTRALEPARWIEGALVESAGAPLAGIDVRRIDAPLDPGAEWNPYRARTGADGRFRVLLGSDAAGEVAIARDGLELGRARLAAGEHGSVRLDAFD